MDRRQVLIAALKAAAKEILSHDPASTQASVKSTAGDIVTAADLASEKVITETIKASFPDEVIVSEESADNHAKLNDADLNSLSAWVVDPIDGTNNFKRGMAYSGVSIGYIENGQPILGGILDPYRDHLYMAELNKGATCNDQPIRVSDKAVFDGASRICTGNAMTPGQTLDNLAKYNNLGHVWVDVLGSAVLIMSDIAAGHIELYFHNGLKPWDNAAGFLIAEEAGAKIVGLKGQPINWLSAEAVIGNPTLVDQFIKLTN